MTVEYLRPENISVNGGTQMRASLNRETVTEYADEMRRDNKFPPILVYYDGVEHWLADGFHRYAAHMEANGSKEEIAIEVRSGTRRDAILYAAGANADHGLRRTNADKQRSVDTMLRDDEWGHWSNREIARRCNVSDRFVGKRRNLLTANVRSENDANSSDLTGNASSERTYTTRHGTTATMNTANIGSANGATSALPVQSEPQPGREGTRSKVDLLLASGWKIVEVEFGCLAAHHGLGMATRVHGEVEQVYDELLRGDFNSGYYELHLEHAVELQPQTAETASSQVAPPAESAAPIERVYRPLFPNGVPQQNSQVEVVRLPTQAEAVSVPISHQDDYESNEWYTPTQYIEAAREVMGEITLDPASNAAAQEVVQAEVFYTREDDGLTKPWFGAVWLNPPYSTALIKQFIDKTLAKYEKGNIEQAVVLVNNNTETEWFQGMLSNFLTCFPRRRIQFWRPDHKKDGARQGQAFFYLGQEEQKFCEVFGEFGPIVEARRVV